MLYFFHHYELPVILEQAQLQHLFYGNHVQPMQPSTSNTIPRTSRSLSAFPVATSRNVTTPASEQTQHNYITELSLLDSDSNNFEENRMTNFMNSRTRIPESNGGTEYLHDIISYFSYDQSLSDSRS